ncbi:WAT1-related protein [Canna indica]|uniref:WAT1-related protein n=1 Tax=Canna indica TaxID=4628 RepID=A0AAQ3KGH0_9LILI|nr:WAT1-related protein [Canna indica]
MAMRVLKEYGPLVGLIYVQVAYAFMFLVARFAFTHGMSHFTFVLYRQITGTIAIYSASCCLPNSKILSIRWKNVKQIFILALIGVCVSQNLYYAGLALTSSTFASAMNNLQPVVTFLLAYLLRFEEVRIKRRDGQAKILGTLMCVVGAMVMTFFKGTHTEGQGLHAQHPFRLPRVIKLVLGQNGGDGSFILGAFLTCVGSWSLSGFLIYQAWIVDEYPSQLALSGHVSFVGSLQSAVVTFIFGNPTDLILQWNLQLLVIAYSGILCTGIGFFITMWCVKEKGPVYATAFSPLSSVIVAILEPLLLHVQFTWTSMAGMVVIVTGLYLVLWGKAQEGKPIKSLAAAQLNEAEGAGLGEALINEEPLLLAKTSSYMHLI